jgi:hypothetical protein
LRIGEEIGLVTSQTSTMRTDMETFGQLFVFVMPGLVPGIHAFLA